jgi:hypothetical protein
MIGTRFRIGVFVRYAPEADCYDLPIVIVQFLVIKNPGVQNILQYHGSCGMEPLESSSHQPHTVLRVQSEEMWAAPRAVRRQGSCPIWTTVRPRIDHGRP